MEYVTLMVQEDTAHDCIARLGRMGVFQFADLNPELTPFQRRYVTVLKRCDEMERKIRAFYTALSSASVASRRMDEVEIQRFLEQSEAKAAERPSALVLKELDELLTEKETELNDLNSFHANLTREYNERVELKHVLNKSRTFLSPAYQVEAQDFDVEGGAAAQRSVKFKYVTGVVNTENKFDFERQAFRSTRGNCFLRFEDIDEPILDPLTGLAVDKVVFIIFFQAPSIEQRLIRICDAFGARRYNVPDMENSEEVEQLVRNTRIDIDDRAKVLRRNRDNLMHLLTEDFALHVDQWQAVVKREKAVYHTLNMFRTDVPGFLRGEAWVVASSSAEAAKVLKETSKGDSDSPNFMNRVASHQWPTPPTYFKTNKVTSVFQGVVDTYGVPRYREANPAPFAMVTFPFLFGVMYGDIGHGSFVFVAATLMILFEKQIIRSKPGEIFQMAFEGRYMLWGMGLFAIYMGIVYNDCFSLGMTLFEPVWHYNETSLEANRAGPEDVYTFGVDPVWKISANELVFVNSLKMKMSVILGVTHMTGGLFLRLLNAIHFRSLEDVLFEAVPQIIFMLGMFGYMNFLIFYKWCLDWPTIIPQGREPPSLINTLINIVLQPFNEPKDALFEGQGQIQLIILVVSLLCIPLMLFPKPLLLHRKLKKQHGHDKLGGHHLVADDDEEKVELNTSGVADNAAPAHEEEEHGLGELFIHQSIETIEFVLGSVSNTASYLRLWALSLAHSELATVFWEKAMTSTINQANPVAVFVGFAVWAGITFGVLLMMDVLECFLHALRLHWVEFMNKFYKADGYRFEPLNFNVLLRVDENDS